jgi:hypothetical protein
MNEFMKIVYIEIIIFLKNLYIFEYIFKYNNIVFNL